MPRASDWAVPGSVKAWQCVICCWIKSCCKHKAWVLETVADVHSSEVQGRATHHINKGWARGSLLSICFLISQGGPWMFQEKKKSSSTIQNSLTVSQVAERAIYLWINNTKRYLSRGFDQQDVVKSLLQPLVVLYLSHNINISRWKKQISGSLRRAGD